MTGSLRAVSAATASEFPAGREGYHSYTEMTADVAAVAAAHPAIVSRFSIGRSYKGRDIWAVKVSDNVTIDEPEPEVMFDGGHHADEHMSTEMTLRILHWLVDGYGTDPRITSIVDSREIWIVFLVNPDGSEFDIKDGRFHHWRKNRQPTPGTSSIGTDLNRNYGYRWGGGGRTSRYFASIGVAAGAFGPGRCRGRWNRISACRSMRALRTRFSTSPKAYFGSAPQSASTITSARSASKA